jgi:hypothetical protein
MGNNNKYLRETAQGRWTALYRAFRQISRQAKYLNPDELAVEAAARTVEAGDVPAWFALRMGRALASVAWADRRPPKRPLARLEWRCAVHRLKAAGDREPIRGPRPWWN